MSELVHEEKGIEITREKDKLNIVMDMSTYDLFELCEAKYNMRHNLLKAPPIILKAKALDYGSLVHEGLETYFKLLKTGISYNDRIHEAIKRIQFVSSDPEQSNADPDEVNLIISAVEQTCDYWRFEDEQMEILEVEQPFAYSLFEDEFIRIIITGKIDLLVNIPQIGRKTGYNNLPIDHKSFQRDSEVLELTNQFINYSSAVQSYWLVVNRVGLYENNSKKKPEEKFQRIPLSYDPLMWEEWKEDVVYSITSKYLNCVADKYWKRNLTSCLKFNRKCEYYEICRTSGREAKLYKLEQNFATVSPWDVTAKFTKD